MKSFNSTATKTSQRVMHLSTISDSRPLHAKQCKMTKSCLLLTRSKLEPGHFQLDLNFSMQVQLKAGQLSLVGVCERPKTA